MNWVSVGLGIIIMTIKKCSMGKFLALIFLSLSNISHASQNNSLPMLKQYDIAWKNWTGNLYYKPFIKDQPYYFMPTTRAELKEIIQNAAKAKGKIKIHVSGQRHSATPIILNEMQSFKPEEIKLIATQNEPVQWLIDLSCYHDLGKDGHSDMMINSDEKTVTVNAGVREDELDAYVTANNFMLKTVTAGGFFSIGGISAVDVHGATVNETNFPGTIKSFTVMNANGDVTTYDNNSELFHGIKPLQFHRVSLGTLGIITSVTINLAPRPYKATLVGSQSLYTVNSQKDFISLYKDLLFSADKSRVESFYNPYYIFLNIRALKWDVDNQPKDTTANDSYIPEKIKSACQIAKDNTWGAPLLGNYEGMAESLSRYTQDHSPLLTNAGVMISFAFEDIRSEMQTAINNHASTWLTKAAKVTFMSYAIPLPDNNDQGLDVAWKALRVVNEVSDMMKYKPDKFAVAVPVEFRFLRGDDAILSATYSKNPKQRYIAIEIVGFPNPDDQGHYQQNLLNFFANVECRWIKMNGRPHQGKMYGFYDPNTAGDCKDVVGTSPFNDKYLARYYTNNENIKFNLAAFKSYQNHIDPYSMFCTKYAAKLGIC